MHKTFSRRQFLKIGGMTLLVSGVAGPLLYEWLEGAPRAAASGSAHTLVVVQLSGGNDGLNTVIPYTSGIYHDLRPHIGIKTPDVLQLTDQFGLHPNMQALQTLYKQGNVAIVHGVGYPNPILSHFQSMAVWHTGDPTARSTTGWIGRYLDATRSAADDPLRAINIGNALPLAMVAKASDAACVSNAKSYRLQGYPVSASNPFVGAVKGMYSSSQADGSELSYVRSQGMHLQQTMAEVSHFAPKLHTMESYPASALGQQLRLAAEMLGAGIPARVLYANLGGFDDHAGEESHHGETLGDFSASVGAFLADLDSRGMGDAATVLGFSEFGRRVKENGSLGTDHGEAGPVFLIGKRVKGGLYGEYPSLSKLHDGDQAYTVDFRSVYATVIEKVLGASSRDVLGATFETIPCFQV